jgi:hypothetical protein
LEVIDDKGRTLSYRVNLPEDNQSIQEQLIHGHTVICHPTAMMRKQHVLEAGKYDEEFVRAQDLDLWLRMGELGELAVLPEILLRYRRHTASVTSRHHSRQLELMRLACERAAERRNISLEFETKPWMPQSKSAIYKLLLNTGWRGFNLNDRGMAIDYAAKALRTSPLEQGAWRLLACALLKKMPARPHKSRLQKPCPK